MGNRDNTSVKIFEYFLRLLRRLTPRHYLVRYFTISPYHYIIILLVLFLACSPALYIPTQEVAEKTGIPLENLKAGRQLYVDHCGSCHMLYLPNQFTVTKWKNEMEAMRLKITFNEQEKQLMLGYLLAGK